ncbi:hypothetical protein B0O99DRAFT_743106 [Bisporella sp. PMI_857]|nr:hypothetical protein B0O99DRAFT_743106 [Bisporella sp. PMI_857]
MSIGVGFGDLAKFIEIAAKTYKYGFSKAQRAHTLYHEFGDNINGLACNLDNLQKIVGYLAENNSGQFLDSPYMTSLADIIGDYSKTLQDCEKFLKDKERFSWQGDFVSNIVWNFSIASEVQTLNDRVAFLNIKLGTVLGTLDLRMANQLHINIFRIHKDLAVRIEGVQDSIIHAVQAAGDGILDYLQSQNGNPAVPASSRPSSNTFTIPPLLQGLFEQEVQGTDFDTDPDRFPLLLGLDAIIYHIYTADTISADSGAMKCERQWLAIAKALWILPRVKSGRGYKEACSLRAPGSFERQINDMGMTVASYVKCLEIRLSEMAKNSAMNSIIPDDETILQTFRERPEMWLPLKKDVGPTPTWELEYSENIMDATLRGPYQGFNQSLHLFKLTDVDLKLVITDTPKPSTTSRTSNLRAQQTNNIMNVDIRRSRFIPLYAASTTPIRSALNITFQGDHLASGSSALVFNKRTELFKFQHAITGYQVVLESFNIGVTTYAAARMIGGSQSEYSGQLQLWRAKKAQNSTMNENENGSSAHTFLSFNSAGLANEILPVELPGSPVTASPLSSSPRSPRDNRGSSFSLPSTSPSARNSTLLSPTQTNQSRWRDSTLTDDSRFESVRRRDSTWTVSSTATSATAATAISLAASGATYTTTVVSNDGTVGLILDPPRPSILVLLLQERKKVGVSYSTLAVEIDESTVICPSSCKCRKDPNSCLRVVIQRFGSSAALTSIRQDAGTDLEKWNLAAFGTAQRKALEKEQNERVKERLTWVAVDFSGIEEKRTFEKRFESVKLLLAREGAAYNRTRARLQH